MRVGAKTQIDPDASVQAVNTPGTIAPFGNVAPAIVLPDAIVRPVQTVKTASVSTRNATKGPVKAVVSVMTVAVYGEATETS